MLLFRNENKSNDENEIIFEAVLIYIKDTKRF